MQHLPIFMAVRGRLVVVAGGTAAAAAKARLLLAAGAEVRVVAARHDPAFDALRSEAHLSCVSRVPTGADLEGAALVFAADDDAEEDRRIVEVARRLGIPANAVDRPGLSDFIMPAIIDRDPITVAVSSGGSAPVLARNVRRRIEAMLPSRLGALARFAARFRAAVGRVVADPVRRRRLWEAVFDGPVGDAVLRGDEGAAHGHMMALLNKPAAANDRGGRVVLVGAGPGDPDLLTLRALGHLEKADVIVHDRLVSADILERARRDAERIDVGKAPGRHAMSQDAINVLLGRLALEGRRVVRLKGGDPFIFGRGGEEAEFLRAQGVEVEIVPGITAATGCAASAGLPLTMRGMASAVTFVTGHGADGDGGVDWRALAQSGATLAVYMGRGACAAIAAELMAGGMAAGTPLVVIENGTRPDERVLAGRLDGLAALMNAHQVSGPALIVIGPVAALAAAPSAAREQRHAAG